MRRREIGTDPVTREPIFAPAPVKPGLLDLSKLCRDADQISTTIAIWTDFTRSEWLRLGQIRLRQRDSYHYRGIWELAAYLSNATDFEHDSAFVMKMELTGVNFQSIEYGQTVFEAWIKSDDPEHFRVPVVDYNPLKHKDTKECKDKHCRRDEPHVIVPEGFYLPPPNAELFEMVRGRRIEVTTGLKQTGDK